MADHGQRRPQQGRNQSALRDHNERLILTTLLRGGGLPGSEIARMSGLSPQTISVIMRKLERDELVMRGQPQRGKVGKPSVPMELAPSGAFSIGIKIGRRSSEFLLTNLTGQLISESQLTYVYPTADAILDYLRGWLAELRDTMRPRDYARIAGIGIAHPYQIWKWAERLGASIDELVAWENLDFPSCIAEFSAFPVYLENDATAAGRAEHFHGLGRTLRNYGYFFVGYFVGGAVVLNQSIFVGPTGNAGAFGSLPVCDNTSRKKQLIDVASLYLLEDALVDQGLDTQQLWKQPQDWAQIQPQVDAWIEQTAHYLACAALTACAVIDFEAIVIDGRFPAKVRSVLVARVGQLLGEMDQRGLTPLMVMPGTVGINARAIGAAATPILEQFFLNAHGGAGR